MSKVPMKLLLIEDDKNECNKFVEFANKSDEIEFVAITNSAEEGLKLYKRHSPEGIILDLELNEGQGSGFDFLKGLQNLKLERKPKIVVTTNVFSDSVYDYLHESKVDFIFYKKQENYSIEKVINTLLLLREYKNKEREIPVSNENDDEEELKMISDKVDKELDIIGVSPHLQGRKYLHDAILYLLTSESKDSKISITQYLTAKYKKPDSTISRVMQNAIIYAWRISSIEDLSEHYTAKINHETGIPTPTGFIYYYVEKIRKTL